MSTIEPNTRGRDFVLGDVHGCFDTVETALGALSYDSQRDRLFSVGDLIDYGPRSADALEWIRERFTATARGNHEDMMLDFLVHGARISNDGGAWRLHWASGWFPSWGGRGRKGTRKEQAAWRATLEALPFAVTVHLRDGGRVGLLHAQGPLNRRADIDWDALCVQIGRDRHTAWSAMWARPEVRRPAPQDPLLPPGITGVDYVCHGHDPAPEPGWTARGMLCIDTGVHWPELGQLTIAELQAGAPRLHQFPRVDVLPEPPEAMAESVSLR